jgi:hypothetical protein
MLHIAFLRNVNQGQSGHPSTSDITMRSHRPDAAMPCRSTVYWTSR